MKKLLLTLSLCILVSVGACSQTKDFADPDSILVGNRSLPKVLLVGSWHFSYPGLDAHQTKEEDRMNIFTPKRQAELKELLDYISRFKPTMIAVEGGRNSGYIIRRYERWKNGTKELGASETDQIAIRLMDRFKLDTLYGVDAYPLLLELGDNRNPKADSTYLDKILARHYFGGKDSISARYSDFYSYKDQMTTKATLLENFLYINSDKVLDRGFGAYVSGGQFDSPERLVGADALSMFWFNRNLRIFRNIQTIEHSPDDRILVLFGSGHVSILKFLFEASPQFELVEFHDLMNY